MTDSVALTIDGREVSVAPDSTILAACERLGIDTPTLCWGQTLIPQNACRVCVVELEGARVLVPACQRRVEAGMRIQTDSDRVRHSRKLVLEFLGSSVDVSTAPTLQGYLQRYGGQPERFAGGRTVATPPKLDNEAYVRDYAKCILCYKCVQACGAEWQNTFAIAVAGRGFGARIATEYEAPLPDSACVYCGNCIAVCPTGALVGRAEFDLRQAGALGRGAPDADRHRVPVLRRRLRPHPARPGQPDRQGDVTVRPRRHPRQPLREGAVRLGVRPRGRRSAARIRDRRDGRSGAPRGSSPRSLIARAPPSALGAGRLSRSLYSISEPRAVPPSKNGTAISSRGGATTGRAAP